MSLYLGYLYSRNLTDKERVEIDKKARINRFKLKFAIFSPFFPIILPMPTTPFFPVDGFQPRHIVEHHARNARNRAGVAIEKKVAPFAQMVNEFQEAYYEYKVYMELSSTLKKISKNVRKDKEVDKSLDKLQEQLKKSEFHSGRGAKKLEGSQTIFYMRAGGRARLFFRYSETEQNAVEIIGETNKECEQKTINNLKKNYK